MFAYTHNGCGTSHEIRIVTDDMGEFMDLLEICQSMSKSDEEKAEPVKYAFHWEDKKPKFKLEDYTDEKYAMHCKTEKEAETFCNFLDANGRKWNDGDSYKYNTEWSEYEENTIYKFNRGYFGNIEVRRCDDIILEFDNFDWSDYESEVK